MHVFGYENLSAVDGQQDLASISLTWCLNKKDNCIQISVISRQLNFQTLIA